MMNTWFLDKEDDHRWIYHRVKDIVLKTKTRFQEIEIIDTYGLGRLVIIDNKIQSAEQDEFIYHEAIVHPAMIVHPEPKEVLILGGGEGAVLREVLRYSTVNRAVMVDIDKEFVKLSKRYLDKWHNGSFIDKRAEVIFADAMHYVKDTNDRFDIIIADITDPIEGGPAVSLYTKEFYRSILKILRDDGIFVTQGCEVSYNKEDVHSKIYKTVASIFPIAESYCDYIPSFGSLWGFVTGSKDYYLKKIRPEEIEERLIKRKISGLKYYDSETHVRLFNLPMKLREMISNQSVVSTIRRPVKVYYNR